MTADEIRSMLRLTPHPREGGFFVETYRAREMIGASALPDRYGAARSLATAIYYLLTPETISPLHRLASDEIFHFYLGDPVEMLLLPPRRDGGAGDGGQPLETTAGRIVLGADLETGMRPQVIVPHGVWQGARLVRGGNCALLGTTVAPGFEYEDYESARRADLLREWPQHAALIQALTRK